jgi:hypothetical protein
MIAITEQEFRRLGVIICNPEFAGVAWLQEGDTIGIVLADLAEGGFSFTVTRRNIGLCYVHSRRVKTRYPDIEAATKALTTALTAELEAKATLERAAVRPVR